MHLPPEVRPWTRPGRAEALAIVALTALAAALRFWRLDGLPPGLHVDEAFNILDARDVLAGARPVFLPANAGRDVLYTYVQAFILGLVGESVAHARWASALVGTVTVPAAWAFVRTLPIPRASRVGLLTAAFTALAYWHLHFSRFGIRAVLFPLIVTLTLWSWWRLIHHQPATPDDAPAPWASSSVRTAPPHAEERDPPPPGSGQAVPSAARRGLGASSPIPWSPLLLCGALLGLAAYAHPLGRILAVVPLAHAAVRHVRWRDGQPCRLLAPAVLVAVVVCLPLIAYWVGHPWAFTGHVAEVSIVGQGPAAVVDNLAKVAGMFNLAGDPAAWRNLPRADQSWATGWATGVPLTSDGAWQWRWPVAGGRPVFDLLSGLLFLGGVAMLLGSTCRGADWAGFVLLWMLALALPSVLTDAAPNFSRTIGIIPAIFLAPALALDRLAEVTSRRAGRVVGAGVILGCLALSGAATFADYFAVWADRWDTPAAFDAEKVALGRYVDRLTSTGRTVYLSPAMADHPTVRVTARTALRGFRPGSGLVLPPGDPVLAAYLLLRAEEDRLAPELQAQIASLGGTPRVFRNYLPHLGTELPWRVAVVSIQPVPFPSGSALAALPGLRAGDGLGAFGDNSRLLRATVAPADRSSESRPVTLVWEAIAPTTTDLNMFVHLHAADGEGLTGTDAPPLDGSYPTTVWRPGEVVVQRLELRLPYDSDAGPFELRVGWYDWRTGERLLVRDADRTAVRENGTTLAIGTIEDPR